MGIQDITSKVNLTVATIPAAENQYTASSQSVSAGGKGGFIITTTPTDENLGLWNFLFSVYCDVEDAAHILPNGSSLTTAQKNCDVEIYTDWARSGDALNRRANIIKINNNDSSSHTYYLAMKAYTLATIAGS